MITLRKVLAMMSVMVLAACGRGSRDVVRAPEPIAARDTITIVIGPTDTAVIVSLNAEPETVIADSLAVPADTSAEDAADEAALSALDDVQLESLGKGTSHVNSTIGVATVSGAEVAGEASGMFEAPRGGTAGASAPTYDIDVETFASHARVQAYVDYFLGPARDRFAIWLGRMARYEGMARDRFRQEGIPEDMVYLGLIESGFSTGAVSRAKAVGMWQFMTATGRGYGLTVDAWVDERRDPFKATDAAARHLADLNGEFGSWYLAAAAYNAGAGRISRGIRRVSKGDVSVETDSMFFQLSGTRILKRETRDYVPKLIAAALIAKEPGRYGFDSLPNLMPLQFDEVVIVEQTGLDVVARLADTTTAALLELNPQFFRAVTPPSRAVIVRVPLGTGTVVAQRWAELPAKERVTVIDHVIARGETISVIAKRYKVDQGVILAANPRLKPRALRVGTRIVIPISPVAHVTAAAPARTVRTPKPAPSAKARSVAAAANSRFHVVRWGESLWQIAQRDGVKVAELREWNDITDSETLKPGVRLVIAPPRGGAPETASESVR